MNSRYQKYISSREWSEIKVDLISIRGNRCERCGRKPKRESGLHLHHKTYDRLYNENPEDLELLCSLCHKAEHGLIKPKKKKRFVKRQKVQSKMEKMEMLARRWKSGKYKSLKDFGYAYNKVMQA